MVELQRGMVLPVTTERTLPSFQPDKLQLSLFAPYLLSCVGLQPVVGVLILAAS